MASAPEVIKVLRDVARLRRENYEAAVANQDWRSGLEALSTSLTWRTIALAVQLGIAPHRFDARADPIDLARTLRANCDTALASLAPTSNKADPYFKTQTIRDVLDGVLDAIGVLQCWTGSDDREPFFLAARAFGLGQAEAELVLAEDGHWDQVAKWRDRRVGRPEGKVAVWRKEAAPVINGWLEADPALSRPALYDKLDKWLDEHWHRLKASDRDRPKYENLGNILREMDAAKLIKLNPVKTKGGKKRKT